MGATATASLASTTSLTIANRVDLDWRQVVPGIRIDGAGLREFEKILRDARRHSRAREREFQNLLEGRVLLDQQRVAGAAEEARWVRRERFRGESRFASGETEFDHREIQFAGKHGIDDCAQVVFHDLDSQVGVPAQQ